MVLERLLYARLYGAGELDQVLFTIGLVFVMTASVTLLVGPENQPLTLPPILQGQIDLGITRYRTYSVVLIAIGIVIAVGLWLGFERTRMGAQIRAAVDNRRMAESLGINIGRLFTVTFAFGSGMAALGGGLGAEFLGLDPQYALKYLVFFLIVVAVGGLGRVTGVFYAALLIGVLDFVAQEVRAAGRDAVHLRAHDPAPALAAAGAVRGQGGGMTSPSAGLAGHPAALAMASRHRLRVWEPIPWILAIAVYFAFPRHLGFGTELLVTILFAISLDLVLGYAGHRDARPRRVLRRRRLRGGHAGQARGVERADHGPDPRRGGGGGRRPRLGPGAAAHPRA